MGQGIGVGEAAQRRGASVVKVSDSGRSDSARLLLIAQGELAAQTIARDAEQLQLSESESRDSVALEVLIRAMDISGSVGILLLSMPVMAAISLLIKVISGGPVLYKQKRVGKNGRIFTLYKFRTMVNNAEDHTGPVLAAEGDERVTCIGRMLRQTRLDELPQLLNILLGDMSLVGPRPERPYFVNQHPALQGIRLAVRPGLTGLAQIRSIYDLKPEHKLKYDYLYIKRRSPLLNLYILLQTVPVIFRKRGR